MTKPVRRQGSAIYYARRVVPKDLLPVFKRAEIWKSLGTADPETAKPLERKQQLAWDEEFRAARATLQNEPRPSAEWLALTPEQRAQRQRQREEWERVQEEDAWNNPVPDWDDLSPEEQRAQDAFERGFEYARQRARDEREAFKLEGAPASAPEVTGNGTRLLSLVGQWAKARNPTAKTVHRMEAVVSWFEVANGRIPVEQVSPAMVSDWVEALLAKGVSPSNARTKLSNLKTLLAFAKNKAKLISANPAEGVSVEVKLDPEEKVHPFDLPALKAIFSSPVYSEDLRPEGGKGDAAYWLPLLALFTGARLNELGQLRPVDVFQAPYVDGDGQERLAWVIRIVADKADGLKLKNPWSARRIPIHQELIGLGFLKFVAAATANGQARLFPELVADKYGTVTANWSKWFGRYLRQTAKVTDERFVFHSFRHGFKDYVREAEVGEDVNDAMTGHRNATTSRRYGSALNYPLRPMVAAMERYRVTGLTLPPPPPAFRPPEEPLLAAG